MRSKRHNRTIGGLALVRLVSVVSILTVSSGGVAYAALQSQEAKLTGNTIQTAAAGLVISNDNGLTFSSSVAGYTFNGLVPGGSPLPVDGYKIFLKNVGSTTLALRLMVTGVPQNTNNIDLTKVHVILTPQLGGSVHNLTLQALIDSAATGGIPLSSAANVTQGNMPIYTIQVTMDSDAYSGPSASIGNITFSFTGVSVAQ